MNTTSSKHRTNWPFTYLGLGLITAATLMLQIALTRVFSVVMWYHMSLVTVSMAMFGMTLGALLVEWRKQDFTPEKALATCSRVSFAFAVSTSACLILCLNIPFNFRVTAFGILKMLLWNGLITIPFTLSGVIVCAVLTRFPSQTGKLYAADLVAAALACLLVVGLLNWLDAPSAILALSSLGAFACAAFSRGAQTRGKWKTGTLSGAAILALSILNHSHPVVRIQYVIGRPLPYANIQREFWNVFSYVIETYAHKGGAYWGPGRNAAKTIPGETKVLMMDTRAGTNLVRFDGKDWTSVRWLTDDVTNIAHQIRPDGRVLVIGVGGGRDVLSALLHSNGKRLVDGVDINPRMIGLLSNEEHDFTGGISSLPNVSLYVDEARSWVARTDQRYQVISIPLVDTSAASSAGAYALTENNLYTQEAFDLFLNRLTPDGVLSVSRWWWNGKIGESHRLVFMAAQTLRSQGVREPGNQILVIRGGPLVTLLMSRIPFRDEDYSRLKQATTQSGFDILYSREGPNEPEIEKCVKDPNWPSHHPLGQILNLEAATDDQPFFFHFFRLSNVFTFSPIGSVGAADWDLQAMLILSVLIGLISLLVAVVFLVPIFLTWKKQGTSAARSTFVGLGYFGAIGLGFMFFESSQVQRLNIFLGYPVYSLTVVLFTLLLFSSLGSYSASRIIEMGTLKKRLLPLCFTMLVTLGMVDFLTHTVTQRVSGEATPIRIIAAMLLMAPPSFLMGMFFPLGVALTSRLQKTSLAWCWAVNGMMSTFAAVLSIALSISFGFSFTFLMAVVCYASVGVFSWLLLRSTAEHLSIA